MQSTSLALDLSITTHVRGWDWCSCSPAVTPKCTTSLNRCDKVWQAGQLGMKVGGLDTALTDWFRAEKPDMNTMSACQEMLWLCFWFTENNGVFILVVFFELEPRFYTASICSSDSVKSIPDPSLPFPGMRASVQFSFNFQGKPRKPWPASLHSVPWNVLAVNDGVNHVRVCMCVWRSESEERHVRTCTDVYWVLPVPILLLHTSSFGHLAAHTHAVRSDVCRTRASHNKQLQVTDFRRRTNSKWLHLNPSNQRRPFQTAPQPSPAPLLSSPLLRSPFVISSRVSRVSSAQ